MAMRRRETKVAANPGNRDRLRGPGSCSVGVRPWRRRIRLCSLTNVAVRGRYGAIDRS